MTPGLEMLVYGNIGMGKTSFALQFGREEPLTCISMSEAGFLNLSMAGDVPDKCENYDAETWSDIVKITKKSTGHIVFDSLSGLQTRLFQHVCQTDFGGQWSGKNGFTSYYTGQRVNSPPVLQDFVDDLRKIRMQGRHIIYLGHMKTIEVPNSMGADYKQHVVDMDDGVRAVMTKGVQTVLFMNIEVSIVTAVESDRTGKVIVGKADEDVTGNRMIYTTISPGHQAKNSLHLPPYINMGSSPEESYEAFVRALPKKYREAKFPFVKDK
jgi:hypothetical protein